MTRFLRLFVVLTLSLTATGLQAENWANWRGPNYNGTSPETGLPETFSLTENVKWQVEMPGIGASTPIIWEDHVFLTSVNDAGNNSVAMALDRKTGKELWRKEFQGMEKDNRSNYASPSAVTDGERVFFFFGNGELAAYDFDGKELWAKNIIADQEGGFAFQWTFSTSPVLYEGKLYMQVLQRNVPVHNSEGGPSFLLALNPENGNEIFRHMRPSKAVLESLEAFTTPMPFEYEGRKELLIAGGDCLTGHDPETGEELWRWGTWNNERITHWRLVPSPVTGDGVVLGCAPKKQPVYAVEAGLEGTHEGKSGVAWVSEPTKEEPVSSDVSTPAFLDGRFYILNSDAKALNCVVAKTGEVIYSERLKESKDKLEASPTIADGKIYMMNHLGQVFVIKAGDEFELLHVAEMGTSGRNISRSGISVSQGNLFIRTDTHLYCVGE